MLTAEGCAGRRARLWGALPRPCDLLVVGDPAHLIYLANFAPSPFSFRSADAGAVLILEPGRSTLVADNLCGPYLDEAHVDEVVAPAWYEGKRSAPRRQDFLARSALAALADRPGRCLGIEPTGVPAAVVEGLRAARPGLELVDLGPVLRPLRRAKDADELALIGRSIRAGEAGHRAALGQVRPGMTEFQAYQVVQRAALEELGEAAIVYGDFVSGPRCEAGGGPPTGRVIARGNLLLIDYSVVVRGYRGDFTNTFAVGGGASARAVELFGACLDALAAGEALLKPGTPARTVDAAVRARFAARGLGDAFRSHTGHGLGLGHPEPPYIVPEGTETLQAGDVVALEPGLRVPGVAGMRYERNYLITGDGCETLTNHELRIQ